MGGREGAEGAGRVGGSERGGGKIFGRLSWDFKILEAFRKGIDSGAIMMARRQGSLFTLYLFHRGWRRRAGNEAEEEPNGKKKGMMKKRKRRWRR